MIRDLPTSFASAILEGLRYNLQVKFDEDNLDTQWMPYNPSIEDIEPANDKGTGIIVIDEEPKNTPQIDQREWKQRTFNIGIEVRASVHTNEQPYYVAHNLNNYLKDYLELDLKRDGITGTFLGKEIRRVLSFYTVVSNTVNLEKRQGGFNLIRCVYRLKWSQSD